jgi:CRISPR/Cas system-associated endoribonuclease Cas2
MNYIPYITLVGWETRNWRHQDRALVWCKDYGLKAVTKHVFVGELYAKERVEMRDKFKSLFTSKTEKFFFASMCKSCFNESMIEIPIKEKISRVDRFELVQIPKKA